ncbi:DUF7010 family protein [Pontibacter burrus]|uniref:Uncharacterized protein n=1 Tax=Pontibacter burrus TaxID=2704466 RepID=A0A6B3LSB5_9BACT|nr:hypothetical protein [Pontibacter burrus]NEM99719.1 hypothetical protein [Pontibacter burrus]
MPLVNSIQITTEPLKDLQNIKDAQQDMRVSYLNGTSGVLVSGTVWLISGLVAMYVSPEKAVWALLIGGTLIHPVSILLNKILGASGVHTQGNPLGRLAMEGTIFMIMCMPLAYGLSFQKTQWFFQGMLLIIGGRYLMFATLYSSRRYWVLGIGLGVAAYLLFTLNASSQITVLVGAAIEIIFALVMFTIVRWRKTAIV